jgi:hypothetical protein
VAGAAKLKKRKSPKFLCLETIPRTPYGNYMFRIRGVFFQLFPNPVYVNGYGIQIAVCILPPDIFI